jgi:mannitol operon repressor
MMFVDPRWDAPSEYGPLLQLLNELNKETERGAALVVGAVFDDILFGIIKSYLLQNKGTESLLESYNAPFGTFSSKIAACFGLGLITEPEYKELEFIRKIRNEFAHKVSINFDDRKIIGYCSSLKYGIRKVDKTATARYQFSTASAALAAQLVTRASKIADKRLKQMVIS